MSKRRNVVIEQGATYRLHFLVRDVDELGEQVRDLSGWTARMQIREAAEAPTALLELSTENGGISVDLADAAVLVVATADQTAGLPAICDAAYDLFGFAPGGEPAERWLWGTARIQARVTR